MKLTHQTLHALFNCGCPNSPQKAILKLPPKLPSGWLQNLVGTVLDDSTYAKLLELKGPKPKNVPKSEWKAGAITPLHHFNKADPEVDAWL